MGFLFAFAMLLLTSCVHQSAEELAVKDCQRHCWETFNLCQNVCLNHCSACTKAADEDTACRYEQYLLEVEVQGLTLNRELQSYRDPLQCRKTTCNCSADFNVCTQACTGIILKEIRAKPFCT